MYQTLLSGTAVSNPPKVKTPLGTPSGLSVKIINQTAYELDIYRNEDQIDALPPFAWVILPNLSGLSVILNTGIASTVSQPYNYVAFTTIDQAVPYQTGSTYQAANGTYGLYNYNETDTGTFTFSSQTIGPSGRSASQFTEWYPITGAKKIYMLFDFIFQGLASKMEATMWLHVTTKKEYPKDYNLDGSDHIYTTTNGGDTWTGGSESSLWPELVIGYDYLRLEYVLINNDTANSYTVSGTANTILGVLT